MAVRRILSAAGAVMIAGGLISGSVATASSTHSGDSGGSIADRDRRLFQRPAPSLTRVRDLQPVEQRIEDVDPLAVGMRRIEPGLRQPFGFEQVYRVPGDDERFMRIDGGLYAVFPRSVYTSARFGEMPLIPANTVFWIGTPDFLTQELDRPRRSEAAEEVWRAFALTPEEYHVSERLAPGEFLPESLWIDGRARESRHERPQQPGVRHRGRARIHPPRWRLAELRVADEHPAEAEADHHAAKDREAFRQRIHALLRRAAKAEANGARDSDRQR